MPKSEKQKLKLFYIADYLMKETDADEEGNMLHGVLAKEIKDFSSIEQGNRIKPGINLLKAR